MSKEASTILKYKPNSLSHTISRCIQNSVHIVYTTDAIDISSRADVKELHFSLQLAVTSQ